MRVEISKINIGKYMFIVEVDTGGNPQEPYTLMIYYNIDKKPVCYINKPRIQATKNFVKYYDKTEFYRFCKKFALDAEYRKNFLLRKET